ncbi:MAG: tetratricopeptide repeat protein [Betaproteobacteria bacterium]
MNEAPGAMFERAYALHLQGAVAQALAAYDQLLERWPLHAETLHYSGVLMYQTGRFDEAIQRIEHSLESEPRAADAWCNLGVVFQAQGRYDKALSALNEALRHQPRNPAILNNRVGLLLAAGRVADAEATARRALAIAPNDAMTHYHMALCQQAQGRNDEALASVERALRANPDAVAPAGLKAQIEESLGRFDAASATLATALSSRKQERDSAPLLFQHAQVEQQRGRVVEAAATFEKLLAQEPDFTSAISELLFLRKELADWHDLSSLQARFRDGVAAHRAGLSPFCQLSDPSTRAEQKLCAQQWSTAHPALIRPQRTPPPGLLRIGYLSADFRQHATAVLTTGLFEAHDRGRCTVLGYSTGAGDASALRARLESGFDRFVDANGWPARQLAARIAADSVDILVDLNGHSNGGSMAALALRPAPLQVSYLGYPGTTGASFIDYLIGDSVATPFEHAADYTEKLVLLPGSYQVNDRARAIVDAPPRAELGLAQDAFVFCSLNQTYKLNPGVLDAWARILAAVPNGVLWLLRPAGDAVADAATANLYREAAARGIDKTRIVFASRRPHSEYLGLYRRADLFLDTWPYNAHTTASDALWAGCPVLTWLGDTFAGRVAASLLTAVGLPELVATSVDAYVARAIALAGGSVELSRHRLHLASAGRTSLLFDTEATARALEDAYSTMADQSRRGVREAFQVTSPGALAASLGALAASMGTSAAAAGDVRA